MDTASVLKLTELLKDPGEEEEEEIAQRSSFTPGSIGPSKKNEEQKEGGAKGKEKYKKEIWGDDEVCEDVNNKWDDEDDGREIPKYDCLFRQKVGANDVFLGMGGKDPSTASCEELLVKIMLPDTKQKDIDLDVKPMVLVCRTPKYKLHLPLVHQVDEKNGSAKWDSEKEVLSVTLPMIREYDFMKS